MDPQSQFWDKCLFVSRGCKDQYRVMRKGIADHGSHRVLGRCESNQISERKLWSDRMSPASPKPLAA